MSMTIKFRDDTLDQDVTAHSVAEVKVVYIHCFDYRHVGEREMRRVFGTLYHILLT